MGAMKDSPSFVAIAELMQKSGVCFGTSGARGLVEAMTDEVCYLYTVAFLQYLNTDGLIESGCEVAVAGDLRTSTPRIISAVIRAIEAEGFRPLYCGAIPSPAVSLLGIERGIPAIMVTGSHIPDDRNGIKFNKPNGEILKFDEERIRAQSVNIPNELFDDLGRILEAQSIPEVDSIGRTNYLNRYLNIFPSTILSGLRVGVYEHSGVARDLLPVILSALGAEVIKLGRSERFVPVDTEAIRPEDVRLARQWVKEHKLDCVVSTDGDADRPLVSDEQGEWLRGDITGILTAQYLQARVVVTPVSRNSAVEICGTFQQVCRTKIGSPFVIEGMQQAVVKYASSVVGYEANGGFLQQTPIELFGNSLTPLPTRDALIVIVAILAMSRQKQCHISELLADLPERFTHSDRIKEFPLELSREKLELLSSGDFEKDSAAFIQLFGSILGSVVSIDYTDGIRITLNSGEVVHLRPSGNSPELRCYTEAESKERAIYINRVCMDAMKLCWNKKT